jgi:TatD DNase family protein
MHDQSLVDYHCHLDLYPGCESVFRECAEHNISVLAVTTTPDAWPKNKELAHNKPRIRVALGLHPQLVAERPSDIKSFERYLPEASFIGEVGLDAGPRHYNSFSAQLKTFKTILSLCAAAGPKVLSVHSVRATSHALRLIEKYAADNRLIAVLHWFNGSRKEAKRAVALGCYFSINKRMLSSSNGRAIVLSLPPDRLLTETDGPFTSINGRPARPTDVEVTLRGLATLRNIDFEAAKSLVATNVKALDDYLHAGTMLSKY